MPNFMLSPNFAGWFVKLTRLDRIELEKRDGHTHGIRTLIPMDQTIVEMAFFGQRMVSLFFLTDKYTVRFS